MLRARTLAASTIAWTVGAVSSVVIGLTALTMIGTGFDGQPLQPLSPNASVQPSPGVSDSDDPSTSASATGAPATTPTSHATVHTISTTGGNAFVQCVQSGAYLYGWAPAPGYGVDDLWRGPAAVVRITFETTLHEVSITARCVGDSVQSTIQNRGNDR